MQSGSKLLRDRREGTAWATQTQLAELRAEIEQGNLYELLASGAFELAAKCMPAPAFSQKGLSSCRC